MATQIPGLKAEQDGPATLGEAARIKVEPPSAAASPADPSDEDIYEDAGDLDFSRAVQGLYLGRIPKYLWESWSNTGDDEEIELGTIRVEGSLADIKRMSLILAPNVPSQINVPKEYNMHMTNRSSSNTYIFTEKDLNGFSAKDKAGAPSTSSSAAFPSQPPKPMYQNRPSHNTQQRETTRRWNPYKKRIPKQTALVGQIETEINCLPVENAEYKRIMDARVREAMMRKPKRETQMVERQPDGRVYVPTGGQQHNAFELGFTKQTKPTAGKTQQYKAARIPENELKDLLFDCFRRYEYWAMRALKQELNQPESYLRQVLEGIAHLVRNGTFANHWQLQRDYQESNYDVDVKAEAAPIADYGDGQDMDDGDEDNVKLEDVLPS
ncbi:MAG: hypothetical protein Q9185_006948 [Variospora sp. 1 TL-2023]